jgi:hypothetical protein
LLLYSDLQQTIAGEGEGNSLAVNRRVVGSRLLTEQSRRDLTFCGILGDTSFHLLVWAIKRGIRSVYAGLEEPLNADAFDEVILGTATEVLPAIQRDMLRSLPSLSLRPTGTRRNFLGWAGKSRPDPIAHPKMPLPGTTVVAAHSCPSRRWCPTTG